MKLKKTILSMLACALLASGLASCKTAAVPTASAAPTSSVPGLPAVSGGPAEDNAVVATIGDYDLQLGDFKYYFYSLVNQVEVAGNLTSAMPEQKNAFWNQTISDGVTAVDFYKESTLNKLRQQTIAALHAVEAGYSVTQDYKDMYGKYFDDLIAKTYNGDRAAADAASIKQYGVNIERQLHALYVQVLAGKYTNEVYAKLSDEEKAAATASDDAKYGLVKNDAVYGPVSAVR
jgi:hypothetical protein